jgi:hypothetical protein
MSLVLLCDNTSYWLAVLYTVNPTPVKAIDSLE